jgi:hypothetical protein
MEAGMGMELDRDQVLAHRLARHGLDRRRRVGLARAAACPASDFQRDSALLALAARAQTVTRETYAAAIDSGDLVLAFSLRAAIHALDPADLSLYGRTTVSTDDSELGRQLGRGAMGALERHSIAPTEALDEVAAATREALANGRRLDRDGLHSELRQRVREQLLPWCKGCQSHHVSPMLWRYAGVVVGMRMDSNRLYRLGRVGRHRKPADLAPAYLRFYGPSDVKGFAAWAGLAPSQARAIWAEIADGLVEATWDGGGGWVAAEDARALESPPQATGTRLIPPRDPCLQQPDRETLVPDGAVRKRLFRAVASPGAVLRDGRLAGMWKVKAAGKASAFDVEAIARLDTDELESECARIARVRASDGFELSLK